MKLDIDFEELVDAFEDSSVIHVYHIDTKKSELIYEIQARKPRPLGLG